MKLERIQEYVTTITAIVVGAFMSYWFGLLAGEGSVGTILSLLGGFCLAALLLSLRQNVWVLLPILWGWTGQLPEVKGHPELRDVIVLSVLVSIFMLTAVKLIRFKPKYLAIDFWLAATVLYVTFAWLRHPTGGYLLASDRVGGRPYLKTVIAVGAYYILARAVIPPRWNVRVLLFSIIGGQIAQGALIGVTHFSPGLAIRISKLYGGVDSSVLPTTTPDVPDPSVDPAERFGFVQQLANPITTWMMAKYPPLTLINPLYAGRLIAFSSLVLVSLLGGFRSGFIALIVVFLICNWIRKGVIDSLKVLLLGGVALLTITGLSYAVHLPIPIQRSLSFLPGRWDEEAIADARHSTEWRVYMWKLMLSSHRYIENRWLGDGFGFSASQLQAMNTRAGSLQGQENFMIIGQVHSGPVSSIRFVGYIGLALFIILQLACSIEAARLARRALKTPLATLAIYYCAGIMWQPIGFLFIFGSYDISMPEQIFMVGLLKMIHNSLDARDAQVAEVNSEPTLRSRYRVNRPAVPARLRPVAAPQYP